MLGRNLCRRLRHRAVLASNVTYSKSITRNYHLGYETMPLLDIDADATFLEKSIRQGCRTVMIHSRPLDEGHQQIYELLGDLAAVEEIDIKDFHIGHCISLTNKLTAIKELQEMTRLLRKPMDSVYFTFPDAAITESVQQQQFMDDVKQVQEQMKLDKKSIGLHFPSSILADLNDSHVHSLRNFISDNNNSFGSYALATNYFTHENVTRLQDCCIDIENGSSSKIIACDVLRLHKKRPGLLNAPAKFSVQRNNANNTNMDGLLGTKGGRESSDGSGNGSDSDNESATESLDQVLTSSVESFKGAMDRCLHVENKYLADIAPSVDNKVAVADICWAHVLTQTQESFRSPEEWEYVLSNHVKPKLEASLNTLRSHNKEAAEFATLYQTLAKHLFSVFLHMHQVRRLRMCQEMTDVLRKDDSNEAVLKVSGLDISLSTNSVEAAVESCTKLCLAAIALSSRVSNVTCTLVAGTEISVHQRELLAKRACDISADTASDIFRDYFSPCLTPYN